MPKLFTGYAQRRYAVDATRRALVAAGSVLASSTKNGRTHSAVCIPISVNNNESWRVTPDLSLSLSIYLYLYLLWPLPLSDMECRGVGGQQFITACCTLAVDKKIPRFKAANL